MESQPLIINNEKHKRFETEVNGEFAYLDYRFYKDDMALMHTFVPESARGMGLASALAKFALEYVKEHKLKLMVYCPYVRKYMKEHTEYDVLLDKKYE
jgi:predicted GNAT family acetyltransferase